MYVSDPPRKRCCPRRHTSRIRPRSVGRWAIVQILTWGDRRATAMAKEDFSNIGDVIRKAGEALAETLAAVNKAVKDVAAQAGADVDREQMVENWIRAARMAKDGMVTALEQGFQWW